MRLLFMLLLALTLPAHVMAQCKEKLTRLHEIEQEMGVIEAEKARLLSLEQASEDLAEAASLLDKAEKLQKGPLSSILTQNESVVLDELHTLYDTLGKYSDDRFNTEKFQTPNEAALKGAFGNGKRAVEIAIAMIQADQQRRGSEFDAERSLATLSAVYGQLKEGLKPLITTLPGIGAFINAYGEALNTAKVKLGEIEGMRVDQADQLDLYEEIATNPFRFTPTKQERLEALSEEREALIEEIKANPECVPAEPEPELAPEYAQSNTAAAKACRKAAGGVNPHIVHAHKRRQESEIRLAMLAIESEISKKKSEMAERERRAGASFTAEERAVDAAEIAALEAQKATKQDALKQAVKETNDAKKLVDAYRACIRENDKGVIDFSGTYRGKNGTFSVTKVSGLNYVFTYTSGASRTKAKAGDQFFIGRIIDGTLSGVMNVFPVYDTATGAYENCSFPPQWVKQKGNHAAFYFGSTKKLHWTHVPIHWVYRDTNGECQMNTKNAEVITLERSGG